VVEIVFETSKKDLSVSFPVEVATISFSSEELVFNLLINFATSYSLEAEVESIKSLASSRLSIS